MKKFLLSVVATTFLVAALIPAAQAAITPSDFIVSVTLAAQCKASNTGLTVNFGTYTAFETSSKAAPSIGLTFNCTRGLGMPSFVFDTANGNLDNGNGVLAGLNYSLVTSIGSSPGTSPTATAGSIGTPDVRTVTITGAMAAGQAGECSAAGALASACNSAPQTHTRTLTITY